MPAGDTYVEWRIEFRRPGARTWRYLPFSGAIDRDEARMRRTLARESERLAGQYELRLLSRTVIVTRTPWLPVTDVTPTET